MAFPNGTPVELWEKLYEAKVQAVQRHPNSKKNILYVDASATSPPSRDSSVSTPASEPSKDSRSSSKLTSLKSFLRGDIQRHHGMYVLEESVTGAPGVARESYDATSRPSSVSSDSTTSSLKKFFVSNDEKAKSKPKPKPKPQARMPAQMRHIGAVPHF